MAPVVGTCQSFCHAPVNSEPRHEKAHHLLICIAEEQAQGQHVIDYDPRRQQPGPLLYPPGFGQHIINQVTIDKARQNPTPLT